MLCQGESRNANWAHVGTDGALAEHSILGVAHVDGGVHRGRAVYLLYNGILKDKSVDGGNVLTSATLDDLPPHDGPRVVYAAGCRFSKARLEREGITFKQTPYAIRTR